MSNEGSATCDQCGAFVDEVTWPVLELPSDNGLTKAFARTQPPHLKPCGHDSSYTWTLHTRTYLGLPHTASEET